MTTKVEGGWVDDHGNFYLSEEAASPSTHSDKAEARCCSAISPCSWQRHHGMDSVCPTCTAAAPVAPQALTEGVAELINDLRSHADEQIEDNVVYIQRADKLMRQAATALASLAAELAEARENYRALQRAAQKRGEDDGHLIAAFQERAESAERKLEEQRKALEFYRDGFAFHPKRTKLGVDQSAWKPLSALLDDCGEVARAALANSVGAPRPSWPENPNAIDGARSLAGDSK